MGATRESTSRESQQEQQAERNAGFAKETETKPVSTAKRAGQQFVSGLEQWRSTTADTIRSGIEGLNNISWEDVLSSVMQPPLDVQMAKNY